MSSTAPTMGLPRVLMVMSATVTAIMNASPTPATTWKVTSSLYTIVKNRFIWSPSSYPHLKQLKAARSGVHSRASGIMALRMGLYVVLAELQCLFARQSFCLHFLDVCVAHDGFILAAVFASSSLRHLDPLHPFREWPTAFDSSSSLIHSLPCFSIHSSLIFSMVSWSLFRNGVPLCLYS